ncbi:hypothetical protein HUF18_13345 [Thalassolituus sp. ST750PaO-4]|uniref:hypothetical protein n=1 Tax=Thalassolituus sp. ST750PaO-4 TaxID=2742965 RepID=UPI001CE33BDF|nr:hypothetical protein [Thalassolituus sp. ST750PaO-4]MCA6060769.1 hypothetical protein [Thalassolituus sp. ST750PaO-4]
MISVRTIMALLLAFLALPALATDAGMQNEAAAEGETWPFAGVYKMPVWIDQVQRVCPWKSDAGEGYIRVVRTNVKGPHGIYLQWIRKGIAGSETQAISTVRVEELEGQYQVHLQMPQPQLSPDACHLTALAESIITDRRYKMELVVKGPGEYQLLVTSLLQGGL